MRMKIALVHSAFENIGIEYISSVLKTRHETYLLFDPLLFNDSYIQIKPLAKIFDYKDIRIKKLSLNVPNLIAFSVSSDTYQWACQLAKDIKEHYHNIPIVFGGVHVTAVPLEVLRQPFVDYVIIGEGEYPMLDLANALEQGRTGEQIMNVGYKKNQELFLNPPRKLIQNLDELPFPDKDLYLSCHPCKLYDYGIITSRGCYYSCTYCHNSSDRKMAWRGVGKYFRQRSVANVIDELEKAKRKYNFKQVSIWDECFTFNIDWLKTFCIEYKEKIGLPFWTNVHPDHVTEEVIRLLEDAGCTRVEMGVQILNSRIKKEILHRNESAKTIKSVINMFRASKIRIEVDIILGIPFMNDLDYKNMLSFFNEVRPHSIHTFWLRYYPSTEIVDIAYKNNILTQKDLNMINQGDYNVSSILGGNTKNIVLEKYQTLLTFLPYTNPRLIQVIVKHNWIKYIPRTTSMNRIILYLLDLKHHDEVIGRRFAQKTLYFIWKKIKNGKKNIIN